LIIEMIIICQMESSPKITLRRFKIVLLNQEKLLLEEQLRKVLITDIYSLIRAKVKWACQYSINKVFSQTSKNCMAYNKTKVIWVVLLAVKINNRSWITAPSAVLSRDISQWQMEVMIDYIQNQVNHQTNQSSAP